MLFKKSVSSRGKICDLGKVDRSVQKYTKSAILTLSSRNNRGRLLTTNSPSCLAFSATCFLSKKKPLFLSFFISICFFSASSFTDFSCFFWYPKWCFRHKNSSFGPKHLQDQLQTLTFSEFWDPGFEKKNRKSLKFQENRRNRVIYDCFWEFLASKSIPKPKQP